MRGEEGGVRKDGRDMPLETKNLRNTVKVALPDSCSIRKNPYGRADLFVSDAAFSAFRCKSSITQHVQRNSIFHTHSQNGRGSGADFASKCDVACWHCCHGFDTPPFALPKHFDAVKGEYVVTGFFCCLGCVKAFALDTASHDSSQLIMLIEQMANECYGTYDVLPSPPRLSLHMFGGPYSIEQFRKCDKEVTIHSTPFVSSYMVVEERQTTIDCSMQDQSMGSVRGMRRPNSVAENKDVSAPAKASPFLDFVKGRESKTASRQQRQEARESEGNGTLESFLVCKD